MTRFSLYLSMLALMVLAGCGGDQPAQPEPSTATATDTAKVSVEDFHYARLPGGGRIITGKLLNPTPKTIRNAQIQIGLFDKDNQLISNMSVTVRDLKPGAAKGFREPVDGDDTIHGARVRGVLVM
ncbi:MAG TPA: FxLYD domain-containing protein [Rhodothermales bacterium]|nr:FxLYD domain-containing protein [Rhodothermales bacterium]